MTDAVNQKLIENRGFHDKWVLGIVGEKIPAFLGKVRSDWI